MTLVSHVDRSEAERIPAIPPSRAFVDELKGRHSGMLDAIIPDEESAV